MRIHGWRMGRMAGLPMRAIYGPDKRMQAMNRVSSVFERKDMLRRRRKRGALKQYRRHA